MNKALFAATVLGVLVLSLGIGSSVFAQGTTPPGAAQNGYASGMGIGRGPQAGRMVDDGILHDGMIAVFAEKFGLTVEQLEARLNNGETISQIASANGLTLQEFQTLMTQARSQAADQAVIDGTLTQAQADLLKTRGAGQMAGGMGAGRKSGMGTGMNRGGGLRGNGNSACPFSSTTSQ